jgi:hypothetical protein
MSTYAYHAIAYLCAISTLSFVIVIPTIHAKALAQTGISLGYEELRVMNRDNSMAKMMLFHWEKALLLFPIIKIIVSRNFQKMGLLLKLLELVESCKENLIIHTV